MKEEITMTKKINRFYSSVLNRIKRQYKDSATNKELLELRQKSECQSYFEDILTYLQTCKDFNNSPVLYLEQDICLIYIFTLTYFEKFIDIIEPYVIKGLEATYNKRINNRRLKGLHYLCFIR